MAFQHFLNFYGHSHPSDVVGGRDGSSRALAVVGDMLAKFAVILVKVDRSVLLLDRDDANLLPLEWVRLVRERDRAIGLRVHELLEVVFRDVETYPDDRASTAHTILLRRR